MNYPLCIDPCRYVNTDHSKQQLLMVKLMGSIMHGIGTIVSVKEFWQNSIIWRCYSIKN